MRIKALGIALCLALAPVGAFAQATKATINAEIDSNLPSSGEGQINAAILRTTLKDFVAASNFQADFINVSQMPALTGDCTTVAGTVATLCTKTNGATFSPWAYLANGTSLNANGGAFSSSNQAMWLVGNYVGDGVGPYAMISATDTGQTSVAGFFRAGLWIAQNIGVAAGEGSRATLLPILTLSNPLPCTMGGSRCFHIASFPQAYVSANLGGSSGAGNSRGDVYGAGALAQASSGATFLHGVIGQETNVSVQTGASVDYKAIASFISVNSDAVGGSVHNAMVVFTADNTTTYKWPKGITFGRPDSTWPFDTSSNLIDSSTPGTGSRVANNGIEFSSVTFSGCSFKSNNFCVDQNGAIANPVTSTGASAGLVASPRGGTGSVMQWYNPSGTDMRLYNGSSDVATFSNAGFLTMLDIKATRLQSTAGAPTQSTCGTGPSIDSGSSANGGKFTIGTGATACTLTFASAFATNAYCTVTPMAQPAAVANIPYISAQSQTAFTVSGGTASASYQYTCIGN